MCVSKGKHTYWGSAPPEKIANLNISLFYETTHSSSIWLIVRAPRKLSFSNLYY